jgi:O-antigen/teichoic acid export membrane protein
MNSLWGKALKIFFGTSVLQVSSILNFIVLARLFSTQEFGDLRQLMLLNQIIFSVVFAAVPISLLFFCAQCNEPDSKGVTARKHLFIMVFCGLLFSIGIYVFKEELAIIYGNSGLSTLLELFFIFPISYMIYNSVPIFLIALDKTSIIKWYCPFIALINTGVVLYVATFSTFSVVFNTIIITAFLSAIIAFVLIYWLTQSYQKDYTSSKKYFTYVDIIGYSWFIAAAALISILGSKIDQFIISNKLGLEVFAIYVVGAFQVPIYSLIQSSINSVMLPQLTSHIVNNDWEAVRQLWRDSVDKISIIALPLAAFLTIFSYEFITFIFGEQYADSARIFLIFSLLAPVKCISFGLIFRASGKPQYDLVGALVFLGLSTTLTFLGVRYWGAFGVAFGIVFATLCLAFLMSVLIKIHTKGEVGFFDLLPSFFFYRFIGWIILFFVIKNIIERVFL